MNKHFVPYELAVKLKELGFNDNCIGGCDINTEWCYHPDTDIVIDVPLWSQAFDWFQYNHKLYITFEFVIKSYGITDCRNNEIKIVKYLSIDDTYTNNEEVKIAGLTHLINLVKEKKNG